MFPLAIEAFDDVGALAFPQPPKPLHQGSSGGGTLCPRLRLRSLRSHWGTSRSSRCKMSAALSTHSALGRLGISPKRGPTGYFRLPDERRPFLNHETCRFQITLQSAARLELAALAHRDVALNFSVNCDRLGFDLATDVRVLANGQDPIGINLALHLSVDQKFLLKLD